MTASSAPLQFTPDLLSVQHKENSPNFGEARVDCDRRLILSMCSKLKQYCQRGIFIATYEALDKR